MTSILYCNLNTKQQQDLRYRIDRLSHITHRWPQYGNKRCTFEQFRLPYGYWILGKVTMKTTRTYSVKKRLLWSTFLAIPLFLSSGASNVLFDSQCTHPVMLDSQSDVQCTAHNGANNSWLKWLSGSSRSTQYQFIDLFELVNAPKEQPIKRVVPTREG